MGYGNWDPVLGAGYWDTGFSISPFLSLGLCVSFFLCLPQFRHSIFILFVVFFLASSCCGVERQPSIHTALPQTVNKSRLLQRLFVLTNSLYEVELQRQLKAAAAYVAICPCPVPASQAHVFFVISFLYPATFENCQKGVSQLYANVCDR